ANLGFLCRRHHRLKTHGGWKLESFADGSCKWRSPEGKNYFVPARPLSRPITSSGIETTASSHPRASISSGIETSACADELHTTCSCTQTSAGAQACPSDSPAPPG
ncbi:MAG: hypothetical protein ACKO75_01240, partial [Actinomycetales bacterium]